MASLSHFAFVARRMQQHWVGKKKGVHRHAELSILRKRQEVNVGSEVHFNVLGTSLVF